MIPVATQIALDFGAVIGGAIITENIFYLTSRAIARSFAKKGRHVYTYRFAYIPRALRSKTRGALHASELPFVFDNLKQMPSTAMGSIWEKAFFSKPITFTARDRATAQLTNGYWINFAKTGDPNRPGLPAWTPSSAKPDMIMIFTEKGPKNVFDPTSDRLNQMER